jgi:hypothetical protein
VTARLLIGRPFHDLLACAHEVHRLGPACCHARSGLEAVRSPQGASIVARHCRRRQDLQGCCFGRLPGVSE